MFICKGTLFIYQIDIPRLRFWF